MKITTVVENRSTRENLTAQYGLSLLVETEYGSILVDAGQDAAALHNLGALGCDLSKTDAIFISHNHYDHIGGLGAIAEATADRSLPIFVSGSASSLLYSKRLFRRRVLVSRNELIEGGGERVVLVNDVEEILPGAYACRIKSENVDFVCKDRKLRMLSEDGKLVPDDFRHEQYLLVRESDESGARRILISGCSHKGIVDIAEWFSPDVLVGGFHVSKMPLDNCLGKVADQLQAHETVFYTCHCTGIEQFTFMRSRMDRLHYLSCGQTITI